MKEIEPTISKFTHRAFVSNIPNFRSMPNNEFALFIATLELEIRDYYKDKEKQETGQKPP